MKRLLSAFMALCLVLAFFVSAGAASGYYYKTQLTAPETEVYDAIVLGLTARQSEIVFNYSAPAKYANQNDAQTAVTDMAFRAFEAVYRDHPEIFWVKKTGISVAPRLEQDGQEIKAAGGTVGVSFFEQESIADKKKELDLAVSNILKTATGTDYDKLRTFHDAIVNKASYNTPAKDTPGAFPDSFEAYGALVEGSAVCEGYSKALKLLCDKAGIPCVIIGGTEGGQPHMWNYVMLDGAYYLVDATFDDPVGGSPNTENFLKGSSTTASHRAFGGFIEGFDARLVNPPLSAADYKPVAATAAQPTPAPSGSPVPSGSPAATADGVPTSTEEVEATPDETTGPKKPKASCEVWYDKAHGGKFSVRFIGDVGDIDPGQSVLGGITLEISAQPGVGYVLESINTKMDGKVTSETKKTTSYVTVTDDCEISVVFKKG